MRSFGAAGAASKTAGRGAETIVTIEPPRGFGHGLILELWDYRELFGFLTWRDIQVRYKQTAVGVLWAVLQPFLTMVVFSIFFGKLAQMPSQGIPYPLFSFAGLLPWTLFSQGVSRSSESLVGNANMLTKVYFPRMVAPVAAILACLVDFALSMIILGGLMVFYHYTVSIQILLIVPLILQALAASVGVGLLLCAANVHYRDIRQVVPYALQLGLFVTPVLYPVSLLPGTWAWLYSLNPMVGVVEGFRYALLSAAPPSAGLFVVSATSALVLLIVGVMYFRRMERTFADVV